VLAVQRDYAAAEGQADAGTSVSIDEVEFVKNA
jgi:hypothetical protein